MKGIRWIGSSLDDLSGFPKEAKQDAGFQLRKVQNGQDPDDWKPMTTIGTGVREIRIQEEGNAFRVIYVTEHKGELVVLHAFQKKTQKTSQKDIKLARARFKGM